MEELEELRDRMERQRPVAWESFPDIGLYMDQVISYLPRQLVHYGEGDLLTSAMVNNYIKDGLLPRAEGKRYSKPHLGYLTAICVLKQVLSVKEISRLLTAGRKRKSSDEELYAYFCRKLDAAKISVQASHDNHHARQQHASRRQYNRAEYLLCHCRPPHR